MEVASAGPYASLHLAPVQTDNHTSTPPLSFLQAGYFSCRPTNSVKALKAIQLVRKKSCLDDKPKNLAYYVFLYNVRVRKSESDCVECSGSRRECARLVNEYD